MKQPVDQVEPQADSHLPSAGPQMPFTQKPPEQSESCEQGGMRQVPSLHE